ncbi:MAG: hypothetical protein J7621_16470, partial [Niastella sp.]|nr:hypothetical protein [Niastella sp.]
MKHFFLILTLFSSLPASSQKTTGDTTGIATLAADFTLYRQILEKAHAGLYKYHSKQQIDSIFNHYQQQIGNKTSLEAFYRHLSSILTYIGSLHDDISLPDSFLDSIVKRAAFFPYPVKVVDQKLLVNASGQSIPMGAEIISINGQPVSSILPHLYKYYTTDGRNITGKLLGTGKNFPLFYRYEFGPASQFHVTYKPFRATQKATATFPAATYRDYTLLNRKRHSLYSDTLLDDRYDFRIIDSLQAAILTVNSFSLGGPASKKHAAYKAFLRQCFTTLSEKNIHNLVVDIRKNGGGTDPNDLLTFSYLARRPFKENKEAFTIFQEVPFKEYYYTDDSTEIADIEENFHEEHDQLKDGRYYQNPSFNRLWQPDSLAFQGKLYLLISPAVASAASLFASMVKSEGYATVIGEESMGGYYG